MVEHFDNLLNNLLNSPFSVWNSYKLFGAIWPTMSEKVGKKMFFLQLMKGKEGVVLFLKLFT